ncbi:erythromycin esterase family protein [Chelativorans sp.]|uniref:erythromycin esterase family protein n=1 Tax=Chelativorans sp. TaxID=2203393 RepID=UPI0028118829|nr:erythromycin esterase family protein [Chelativorans sp.]
MPHVAISERSRLQSADEAANLVRGKCEPLPSPEDAEAFGAFFDAFADARVVLLGEATHGTSEFYRARAAITRQLVEKHGFNIIAVEADWPDAARVDRYVRHRPAGRYDEETFARFPTWMWRNRQFEDFVHWLRAYNAGRPAEDRAEFRGLDVYSLDSSIEAVIAYLDRVDPDAARTARRRYGCLTPWQDEPAHYGRAMLRGGRDTCEGAVVAQLGELLARRLDYAGADGEDFFDAAQNARIVRAAEHYYRIMYYGSTESWNLRNRHMFDTLKALLARRGPGAKAVVWAHNSHIGNAAATAMGWQGEFNIGELCRTAFGDEAALIGFGTDRGTVAAADDWGGPMRIMEVNPSRPDSYERVFRQAGIARSLTDLRTCPDLRDALAAPRLERAIGVIYRPQAELHSHYFEAVLPEQFDAFVWFEETHAVAPLPAERPHGVPETYPFGL